MELKEKINELEKNLTSLEKINQHLNKTYKNFSGEPKWPHFYQMTIHHQNQTTDT